MKRTLVVLAIGLLIAASASCAAEDNEEESSEATVSHGKHGFWNPEQHAAKLQEKLGLSDDQAAQLEAIFADETPRSEKHQAIERILTPEQLAKLEKFKHKHGHHGMRGPKDPEQHAAKLQEKLGLSDDQAAQLEAIFADETPRSEKHQAIERILTPEQLAKLEKFKHKHGHHGMRGPKDPEQHAAKLQEKLGLSDDQAAQLEAIFADETPRSEKHQAIERILTPEQLARFEELKRKHGHQGQCDHGQCGRSQYGHGK